MAKWALALRQTTTYLGLVAIAIIWVGIYLLSSEQRQLAYQDALRQGSNLARVLEEYIRRVVQESDNALLALRQDYQRDPQNFDLPAWVAHTQSRNNLTAHFGITDAKGFVILSSHGPLRTPLDVADRRPFTFQRDSTGDHLFISAPLIGQVSRRLTIEFTRRLNKADGTFSGTVASALDVSELERFFSSLDLGRGGIVSLVSNDAVVLARGGTDPKTRGFAGMTVRQTRLFQMLKNGASGTYWNAPSDSAHFEGVERLMSYRAVSGIPLIAVVGLAQEDIFRHANATLRKYLVAGTILTLIVLIVMFVGAARQARMLSTAEKLRQSTRSLERSNLLFQTALESMAHGLCIFDRDMRLVVCNEQYAEMYGLRPEQILPGTTLRSVLEARVSAGLVPGDANQYIRSRLAKVSLCDAHYAENDLSDGRVYAVSHRPMPDGGWVATHIDVTEQRRAERQLGETKQFLDSIIEHIPVAIVVKDATTRKYILVNRAFETMLGIPRSELLGRTTFDIHRPKDAKNVDDADTEAIQNSDRVSYNETRSRYASAGRPHAGDPSYRHQE